MAVSIQVEGIASTLAYLKAKDTAVGTKLKTAMTKSAIFLQGEVKLSIAGKKAEYKSVDTGRFLNSVDFQAGKDSAQVFSKLPYARNLEYGTNFKNSPRKHFRNSADRSAPKIKNIIQAEVNTI